MKLSPYGEAAYCLMRFLVGALFSCHGAAKLFGAFGGPTAEGQPRMLLGGSIEFVGGLLIAAGLFTSLAALLASGEMAFVYFSVHFPRGFWPIQNGGELAVVYCFLFLLIAALGGGLYSVDRVRRKSEPSRGRGLATPATIDAMRTSPEDFSK